MKFLLAPLRKTTELFLNPAVLYLGRSLDLEMFGEGDRFTYDVYDFVYSMIATLEETLEPVGLTVFIMALVDYIAVECGNVNLTFSSKIKGCADLRDP